MMNYYKDLVEQSLSRTREATLSILGLSDSGLRKHIENKLSNVLGEEGCFLAPPVFEHTFGWRESKETFSTLSGTQLSKTLVSTLQNSYKYSFSSEMHPYEHQIIAWNTLLNKRPTSTVITTGTGSGKTECFMVPILDDLIREYEHTKQPLVGVRALFLYPLNALINSQQERLDAWTRDFEDGIRFCLYNGKTEERANKVRKSQKENPNQVLSRELLRLEPAPMLLTNSTMLEYMLVRQIDNPIISISREQKSLRWIVLDEAHTYIGSQAAELSLLLRRVVHAFGKSSEEIRFVATSATIADENANERLQQYLADLAGVSLSQVVVIQGNRVVPDLEAKTEPQSLSLNDVQGIESDAEVSLRRYEALMHSNVARKLRHEIVSNDKPRHFLELIKAVDPLMENGSVKNKQRAVLGWLDVMTGTKQSSTSSPFLMGRMHLFQRMFHGIWSCVDPDCTSKPTDLKTWPYGNVYVTQRSRCECQSPVYEVGFCTDCQTPHLIAEDNNDLLQQRSPYAGDEFSLNYENEYDDEDELNHEIQNGSTGGIKKLVIAGANHSKVKYDSINLERETLKLGGLNVGNSLNISILDEIQAACSCCENVSKNGKDFLRLCYLGAPFYIANAVPTVLEYCPDPEKKDCDGKSPEELPGRGRKLITFTDSRQGTARMAVRMQQEAERSKLRGLVFEAIRNEQIKNDSIPKDIPTTNDYDKLIDQAKSLEKIGMASMAADLRKLADETKNGTSEVASIDINWIDLVNELASTKDISQSILDYNRRTNPELFSGNEGGTTMARLLLAREYARRPKNQNSTETLGLVKIGYPGLSKITAAPNYWKETKAIPAEGSSTADKTCLTLQDWKDYLKVLLDFYIRENTFVKLDQTMQRWMGSRFLSKLFYPPGSVIIESSVVRIWPQIRKGPASRPIKLLELGCGLDRSISTNKDKINLWLTSAWQDLVRSNILEPFDNGYTLNLNSLSFSLPSFGWVCPVTRRIFDTTFRGLTPYLPSKILSRDYRCRKISQPKLSLFKLDGSARSKLIQIRELIATDIDVQRLRDENLWTDICDRTVEGGFYYRTAEHSAQQSSKNLEHYEELFKKGKINVLNCSTTMEMGVDIGGVSAVVMNNVPPHPANYLQRAGRAGRRSESRAIAYTLCKGDPHNQRVFSQPEWPFVTAIPAPSITLSSDRIVQRHVNALLLSYFLKSHSAFNDNTKLTVKWFYRGKNSPCDNFIDWLGGCPDFVEDGIRALVKRTGLAGRSLISITEESLQFLFSIQKSWNMEAEKLTERFSSCTGDAYKKAVGLELERHENEYLLRDLAAKAFLPGYGFPTNVVNLNTYNVEDFINKIRQRDGKVREDNIFTFKEQPARGLDVAIREYAPGTQIVIDGRVYRSAGIGLHWHSGGAINEAQKFDIAWRCTKCGASGVAENAYTNSDNLKCTHCSEDIQLTEKKMVLKPAGFVTDFYEPTSNNVNTQKYIRVERPRVQLDGELMALPDIRCGFLRYGHNGTVFYHSSGVHERGYAVCLSCGRAESMLSNGNVPAALMPDKLHRPVGGVTGSRKEKDCSGEAVKRDIYLGYHTRTDVLELCLQSPKTGAWLSDSNEHQIIAMTLAVALRDSIAKLIGVASTEMGFSVRLDRDLDSRTGRSIIQLYDQVSGGAGFVLAGLSSDIVSLLKNAASLLDCPTDCENVCSHCLANQDSRVELEELDRKKAKRWLEENEFLSHLVLPKIFSDIPGAKYCSFEPQRFIRAAINRGADSIVIALYGDPREWDLGSSTFRDKILTWSIVDKLTVCIGVPSLDSSADDVKADLINLNSLGIKFFELDKKWESYRVPFILQVISGDHADSLFCDTNLSALPGENWLGTRLDSVWVTTNEIRPTEVSLIDSNKWMRYSSSKVIEIVDELNGPLDLLSDNVLELFSAKAPEISNLIRHDKAISIEYSDRYLKSPWSVMLLGSFLSIFKNEALEKVNIKTLMSSSLRSSFEIKHDFLDAETQEAVLTYWVGGLTTDNVNVQMLANAYELQHSREITINWKSGLISRMILDQGMGYWQPRTCNRNMRSFNFNESKDKQIEQMIEKYKNLSLLNGGVWPTFITLV